MPLSTSGGKPLEVRFTGGRCFVAGVRSDALGVEDEEETEPFPFLRRGTEAADFCVPEVVGDLSSIADAAQPLLLLGSLC
jgi:hypothetical protein